MIKEHTYSIASSVQGEQRRALVVPPHRPQPAAPKRIGVPTLRDKILDSAKPSELPVEQAMKLELVIKLKTAKAPGISVPPSLMARADEVSE
jgi:hypothetical protein